MTVSAESFKMKSKILLAAAAGALSAGGAVHADAAAPVPVHPLREAYYGDLHLHTSYSFDAYFFFPSRVTPDQAYKFARGEPVPFLDHTVQRQWPLDFLAVTDHSENIGVARQFDNPASALSQSPAGHDILKAGGGLKSLTASLKYLIGGKPIPGVDTAPLVKSAWQDEITAANSNYQPGKFTSFIAYEWSSTPDGQNLHRNVFFRGDSAPAPFTSADSDKPEDLWTYLETNRAKGVEALSISHNANASNGLMYDWKDSRGRPIDESYAQRRALNEPLTEIGQNKGSSETHPALSPNDEFANFEIYDHLLGQARHSEVHGSYVRDAFGRGLFIQQQVGVNPYKFGVVGATDFHDGLSTSNEDAFGGTLNGIDPRTDVPDAATLGKIFTPHPGADILTGEGEPQFDTISFGSGNITGVWAESNTRASIYDALRRKETFATSGSRLKFRFFGGWDYSAALLKRADWVKAAYAGGVPMGGDLPAADRRNPKNAAPRFAVWAVKDPDGANLDRAQVIKVWLDGGAYREKVFDVALSNGRKVNPSTGRTPALHSSVDLKTASYANTIGAAELATVWRDPEFDPRQPAVYYLRVIEIPTPRWSTLLAVKRGLPLPAGVPATIQERGWSSPIWYTPAK
jgi:hypothetical protein